MKTNFCTTVVIITILVLCFYIYTLEEVSLESISTFFLSSSYDDPITVWPGVILWAHGRSATDTFADMLRKNGGMNYCNGRKEGFKMSFDRFNYNAFRKCILGEELLTHVKPMHIILPRDETIPQKVDETYEDYRDRTNIHDTKEFFLQAKRAGFGTVVTTKRLNGLATMLSSMELNYKHSPEKKDGMSFEKWVEIVAIPKKFPVTVEQSFANSDEAYNSGVRAAREIGYVVKEFSFEEVTTDACAVVMDVLVLLEKEKDTTGFSKKKIENGGECVKVVSSHVKTSAKSRGKPLEERVGAKNSKYFYDQLIGTEHEWMLDLNALNPTTQRGDVPDPTH